MRSTTILLINFHSTCNAGDLALLEAAISQIRTAFDQAQIVVSVNYPEEAYFKENRIKVVPSPAAIIYSYQNASIQVMLLGALCLVSWISAKLPFVKINTFSNEWNRMIAAYREADIIVGCPGNQFFTMGRFGWPLIVSASAVFLAHLFRKPFYVMPQSLGPLKRHWERWLMNRIYQPARLIFLRDSVSYRLAKSISLPPENLILTPDLAFSHQELNSRIGSENPKVYTTNKKSGAIGVTVIRQMVKSLKASHFDPYYAEVASALAYMIDHYGIEIVFFPQVTGPTEIEDDRVASHQVANLMKDHQQKITIITDPLSPSELKISYRSMDIFIATRLHSGIFALSLDIPTLFVGYLTKTRGILEDLGMEAWLVEFDNLKPGILLEKMENLWLQRMRVQDELKIKIPRIAEQTTRVGDQIYRDFLNG